MNNKNDLLSELERVADAQDLLGGSDKDQKELSKNYIKTTKAQDNLSKDMEDRELNEYMQFLEQTGEKKAAQPAPQPAKPAPVQLDKKQEKIAAKNRALEEKQRIKEEKIAAKKAAIEEKQRIKEEKIAAKKAAQEEKERAKAAKKAGKPLDEKPSQRPYRERPDAEELRRKVEALLAGRKTPEQKREEAAKRIMPEERPSTPPLILDSTVSTTGMGVRTHMGIMNPPAAPAPVPVHNIEAVEVKVEPDVKPEPLPEITAPQSDQPAPRPERRAKAAPVIKEEPKPKIDKKQQKAEEKARKQQAIEQKKAEEQRKKEEKEAEKKRLLDEKKQAAEDKKRAAEEAKRLKKEKKQGKPSLLISEEMKDDAIYYILRHPIWVVSTIMMIAMNVVLVRIIMQILGD